MENTAKNGNGNYPQATGWYWWRASADDEWMVVRVLCWPEGSDITVRGFPWQDSQVSLPAMADGKYGPQYQMDFWEWVEIHEPNVKVDAGDPGAATPTHREGGES